MFLNSKDSATIVTPSAYDCRKLPKSSRIIIALHVFIHQCMWFRRAAFVTLYSMRRLSGLSRSICRLRLTVGCCEKIMANSISPHAPVRSIATASNAQTRRLRRRSIAATTSVSSAKAPRQTIGERISNAFRLACSTLISFAAGSSTQNERLTSSRFVPSVFTITACSKSSDRRSGRNCCCSNVVLRSAFTPRSRSLPKRAQRCSSL